MREVRRKGKGTGNSVEASLSIFLALLLTFLLRLTFFPISFQIFFLIAVSKRAGRQIEHDFGGKFNCEKLIQIHL